MAFVSFSANSDVYVDYIYNHFCCLRCALDDGNTDYLYTKVKDMVEHLNEHKENGHKIPDDVFDRLKRFNYGR